MTDLANSLFPSSNLLGAVVAILAVSTAVPPQGALIGCTLLLMASGLDPISSFTAIVASLNNTGPGLNQARRPSMRA